MKKRLWLWFLAWTVPFLALTLWFAPLLGMGLVGFFALYALLAWRSTGYARNLKQFKEALKNPKPLAEIGLVGLLVLLFLLAAYRQPDQSFLVLVALIPLLAAMAFPEK